MSDHILLTCQLASTGKCAGCRDGESGLDCIYDVLSVCSVCGGMEGALLPSCPGRWLSTEEHDANYAHYCAQTGPFGCRALVSRAKLGEYPEEL
jgi:hypothetical protein